MFFAGFRIVTIHASFQGWTRCNHITSLQITDLSTSGIFFHSGFSPREVPNLYAGQGVLRKASRDFLWKIRQENVIKSLRAKDDFACTYKIQQCLLRMYIS